MNDLAFYQRRAAEARADAELAVLQNVKERCLRSEAAWNALAERVEQVAKLRAERLAHDDAAGDLAISV
jgi:hypothetical protein